jgi:hypothetical protein
MPRGGGPVTAWRRRAIAAYETTTTNATRNDSAGGGVEVARFEVMRIAALVIASALFCPEPSTAEPVAVRFAEGLVHGFLSLRTLTGTHVADGDLIQRAQGDRVTTRLVFRFRDGSLRDETAVFTQRGTFRLISNRLVQKGPSFPQMLDMSIDGATGQVTVRYTDDGKEKVESEKMDLPADLANGITLMLLKNVNAQAPPKELSMVVATPKPRLVKLQLSTADIAAFSTGGTPRKATHFVVKVDIGGFAGLIAPLVGKQPEDTHVWVLGGEAPAFVKSEGPMFLGGPMWRIELVSPTWPKQRQAVEKRDQTKK